MLYRVGLAVFSAVAALTITSSAFAGCCGGCGGCGAYAVVGAEPMAYAPSPMAYMPPPPAYMPAPVTPPVMLAPAPIAVDHWDTGDWGGCGCGRSVVYAVVMQPTPFYVVNQGPVYSGPGLMIPYGMYAPQVGLAVPGAYPYIGRRWYRHHGHWAHWRHSLRARD